MCVSMCLCVLECVRRANIARAFATPKTRPHRWLNERVIGWFYRSSVNLNRVQLIHVFCFKVKRLAADIKRVRESPMF